LPTVAKLAVRAAALDDAENYAMELLASAADQQNWNYGNAIFFGNMVLGQVAFRRGDVGSAVSRLLSSGKTPGSPQLNSFGPNMALAKDLLTSIFRPSSQNRIGRPLPKPPHGAPTPDIQQSVLNFFDLCRVFWTMGADRLDNWSMQVKAGVVPDFGANLYY